MLPESLKHALYPFVSRWHAMRVGWGGTLISYPKSGRTWVRYFLGTYRNLVQGTELNPLSVDIHNAKAGFPMVKIHHGDNAGFYNVKELAQFFAESPKPHLVLFRDPRDVAVSMWFQITKRKQPLSFPHRRHEQFSEYLRDTLIGLPAIIRAMDLSIRFAPPESSTSHYFFYEDLRVHPAKEFRRMLEVLRFPYDESAFEQALEASSFEAMKVAERENRYNDARLAPGDPHDEESFKVRRGKVGGYRDYFAPEDVAFSNACLESLPPLLRDRYKADK